MVGGVFFANDLIFLDRGQASGMDKPYFKYTNGRVDFSEVYFASATSPDFLRSRTESRGEVFCCTSDFWRNVGGHVGSAYSSLPDVGAVLSELKRQNAQTKSGLYRYALDDHPDFYVAPEKQELAW